VVLANEKRKAVCIYCEKAVRGFPKERSKEKDRKRKCKVEIKNKVERNPREVIEEWKRAGEWQ
jgi:hypothetical protein